MIKAAKLITAILTLIIAIYCNTLDMSQIFRENLSNIEVASPVNLPSENNNSCLTETPLEHMSPIEPPSNIEHFSLSSSNQTLPDDIIQEVWFFPGGGGGAAPCPDDNQGITVKPPGKNQSMTVEPNQYLSLQSCGWSVGEKTTWTIYDPSGSQIYQEQRESHMLSGCTFFYQFDRDAYAGEYRLRIEGETDEIETTVDLVNPSGPRMYFEENWIFLRYFKPNEQIRVLAYEVSRDSSARSLRAWQAYITDSNGDLEINIDLPDPKLPEPAFIFAVVGEVSGQADEVPDGPNIDTDNVLLTSWLRMSCAGLQVRECPGNNCRVITHLDVGTIAKTMGQPELTLPPPSVWIPVRLKDGTEGWLIDSDCIERIHNTLDTNIEISLTDFLRTSCDNVELFACPVDSCEVKSTLGIGLVVKPLGQPHQTTFPPISWIPVRLKDGTEGWLIYSNCLEPIE